MSRLAALLRGLGALLVLAALLVGVPIALWVFVGWPLPHAIPTWGQLRAGLTAHGIPDEVLLKILACVCWMAWFGLLTSVVTEVAAAIRGRAAKRLPLLGFVQPVAAHLVAAVIFAVLTTSARPQQDRTAPLSAALARHPAVALATSESSGDGHGSRRSSGFEKADDSLRTYVVVRHDTLWDISEHELGDPLRWREIYRLNEGKPQTDGRSLSNPNRIYPGWVLRLPAEGGVHRAPKPVGPTREPPVTPSHPGPAPHPRTPHPTSPHRRVSPPSTPGPSLAPAPPAGIDLSTGAYIGGSFAAGVLAAVVTGRLRRRRQYRPAPPIPGRSEPPVPLAPALQQLLRATRSDDDRDQPTRDASSREATTEIAIPAPSRVDPEVIDLGTRDDETERLRLTERAGLALTGPGAEPAVRAWVAGLVTATGPFGAEVILAGSAAEGLLAGVPPLPGVRAIPGLADALDELEVEVIARARRLTDYADAAAYRAAEPADPLPFLLLVAGEVPRDLIGRLKAILAAGQRLSIGALLLERTASVDAHVEVDEEGHLADISPELSHLLGVRLYQLGAPDARDLLEPVAKAHAESSGEPAPVVQAPPPAAEKEPPVAPLPQGPPVIEPRPSPRSNATKAPIQVRLLGPYTIEAWGEPVATGLRGSARELLAWYLVHPQGARAEAAIEAIWPDVPVDKGPQRFWTALGNLRSRLRGPSGAPRPELLVKSGDHYEVEADVIEVDVWRFESALAEAVAAGDSNAAMTALSAAVDVYRGDFVEDADYRWAEPVREDLHRRALDACVRLAELQTEAERLDPAMANLERAIEIDPYAEEIYRRLMRLQAQRNRPDALVRTWRLLQGRLAELDVELDDSTVKLYRQLSSALASAHSSPSASREASTNVLRR